MAMKMSLQVLAITGIIEIVAMLAWAAWSNHTWTKRNKA
jgi:predicted negative regulator of RcsB-dependent stress response